MIIKPYVIQLLWWVNMKFVIAFTAPSIPISICLGRGDVGLERGGEGGRLFSLCVFSTMLRSFSSYSIKLFCFTVDLYWKRILDA